MGRLGYSLKMRDVAGWRKQYFVVSGVRNDISVLGAEISFMD